MAVDAFDWLDAHGFNRVAGSEPTRDYLPEDLRPGDVTQEGCIVRADGSFVHGNHPGRPVWLIARQAYAAEYYGWRQLDALRSLVNLSANGQALYPMVREG